MNINKKEYNKDKVNYLASQYVKSHKGETQDSVASKIGISKSTLYGSNPTVENVLKICSFFEIGIEELFVAVNEGKETKKKPAKQDIAASPVEVYEPPAELAQCYKTMYEQQVEITRLQKELEEVKKMNALGRSANAG